MAFQHKYLIWAGAVGLFTVAAFLIASWQESEEDRYLRKLSSPDKAERASAAEELGAMHSVKSLPMLFLALEKELEAVRLQRNDDGEMVVPDGTVTEGAFLWAIISVGEKAIPFLYDKYASDDAKVRYCCMYAVAQMMVVNAAVRAIPMFEAGLSDECPMVRMWGTRGLCDLQMTGCSHHGVEAALQRMLREEEDVGGGRYNAIYLLGKLGCHTSDTIAALVDMLADGDPTNRACAADSLGMIGSPNSQSAVPALKRLAEDEERFVRDAALVALRKITGSP